MTETAYDFDVLVIGAGHAGTEAALAAARLGAKTALLTSNLDTVGQMSCNPAIGGVAKGQIVREIDALGGAMGRAIDATGIQFRMLNRSKGPAMHGPRAQADRRAYQQEIKRICEEQPGLWLRQETVEELLVEKTAQGRAADRPGAPTGEPGWRMLGVRVQGDAVYRARSVVLCAGTFMRGLLHYGPQTLPGGRAGEPGTSGLSLSLERLGFRLARFKTGTPPRLNARTIDVDRLAIQEGDEAPEPFSFLTERLEVAQLPCWITYTNPAVHELIRANLHRAPMFTGQIQSTGPRYCPSIETKVVRFADRPRHQIFLEPEGRRTQELYVNGLSTSLPREVQDAIVRRIAGLERAEIVRYGYAIEYDFVPPDQLQPSLETKRVAGLYLAGQVNGTTGYEEAAGQGLLAGVNAALRLAGKEPLVLRRDQAYLGVMIDDLVTRGVEEPYRMFTSRAEYRLRLRHDNADRRLTPIGHALGLVDEARWRRLTDKESQIAQVSRLLEETRVGGLTLAALLRRTETTWDEVVALQPPLAHLARDVVQQVVYDAKYAGYLARQEREIERQMRLAQRRIPEGFEYDRVRHLRAEARERLARVRPANLGQAGRISGITPADLAVLMLHLEGGR
ncbi:MAG: tRNA uridine-5-carboxymethylaminomethyl(34) synthesis enzyme MnmG [Thermoguttaceae bacterium]|jgi:tRNA uridine 5-carboxymethylaminomethyl modification enzyme|nr:tRNA uridine-5-carboxymethylaminomethyl(34) synthesis enzyme MnmG [Thermoguttaceae bacterium]